MLIIFEGADGSGKTSLLREFNRITNYKHITVDRLHLSHMVYAQQSNRDEYFLLPLRDQSHIEFRRFVYNVKPLIVYLYADPHVLEERIVGKGEDWTKGPNLKESMRIYDELIEKFGFVERVMRIDTTMSPTFESMTERIVGKIGALEKSEAGRHS